VALKSNRLTIDEGTTSKGKFIATVGGIIPPSSLDLSPIMEETVSALSQVAAGDMHSSLTYESQLVQMFVDMKEEMAKQALFDYEREQAAYD